MFIPKDLYTKEINSYIRDLILDDNAQSYHCLDQDSQDHLVALGIRAFGSDIEIILSQDTNALLAKYLLSHDRDDEIEFREACKASAREHFGEWFDQMIQEKRDLIAQDDLEESGRRAYMDRTNGEVTWL